jgi:very-short-patch-repair endonuclease
MTLLADIRRRQVAATYELLADGWTSRQLSRAVARGDVIRVRQGWYAAPELAEEIQRAVRVGGRLTCLSAARMLGLATTRTQTPHVAVVRHASRLRSPDNARIRLVDGAVVHWTDVRGTDRVSRSALDSLLDMAYCRPVEQTIAAVDSALRRGLFSRAQWIRACSGMPRRLRRLLGRVDGRAESITESFTRIRLIGLGFDPRPQVPIAGVGRVDLMIGTALVIEIDGLAYHSDPRAFESDRRRDARLSVRGYRVLRFSYKQVMERWSEVKAAILAAVARGDHLR